MNYQEDRDDALNKPFAGRTVVFVDGAVLYLDNGDAWEFKLDGDCCSSSEYTPEGLGAFQDLLGRRIQKVEDRHGGNVGYRGDEGELNPRVQKLARQYPPSESDSWHFLIFETDRGHVTVDWRNQSNGYYDGSISLVAVPRLPTPLHDAALERKYEFVRHQLPFFLAKESSERMLIHIMKATEARLQCLLDRHKHTTQLAPGKTIFVDDRGKPMMTSDDVEELERIRVDLYLAILDCEGK